MMAFCRRGEARDYKVNSKVGHVLDPRLFWVMYMFSVFWKSCLVEYFGWRRRKRHGRVGGGARTDNGRDKEKFTFRDTG